MSKMITCKDCKKWKPHKAKGLCKNCYQKQKIKIICKECGELKPYACFGLCYKCYQKQNLKVCTECGKLKPHASKGLCGACYQHKMGMHLPYNKNKTCATYLGTKIEKLLIKRFKNTIIMPMNNIGFDFLCSKNYKIDAKSCSLKSNNCWIFNIKRNQIADYFCCVGIDNREDMNIINAWLIPSIAISKKGIIVNNLTGLTISKNKIKHWEQYEMDIDILDNCCTKMKE